MAALDRFLDQGRYRLILRGAPQAQDTATIEAKPFAELQPTPQRLPSAGTARQRTGRLSAAVLLAGSEGARAGFSGGWRAIPGCVASVAGRLDAAGWGRRAADAGTASGSTADRADPGYRARSRLLSGDVLRWPGADAMDPAKRGKAAVSAAGGASDRIGDPTMASRRSTWAATASS
jgi:hypothetical protein